jgi:C1A family cysteine protease
MTTEHILNCSSSNIEGTDWEYPVSAAEVKSLPENFTRRNSTYSVINQGSVGSCVGQAMRVAFGDTAQCKGEDISAMWIYKKAKHYDYWRGEEYSGTSISGACKALLKEGGCVEEFYPYRMDTEEYEPEDGAAENASDRKIEAYYQIKHDNVDLIKEVVMREPLIVSLQLREKFYAVRRDGIVPSEKYFDSPIKGGHAMAVTGWKTIEGKTYWELQNSWGDRWANDGFCYIEWDVVKRSASSNMYYLVTEGEEAKELHKAKKSSFWKRVANSFMGCLQGILSFFTREIFKNRKKK